MEFEYLEVEDVEELHQLALDMWNGLPGRPPGKLEAKLAIPYPKFGFDKYPSVYEKAAVYHYHLASGHCFNDGNKRTSYLAAFTFLDINGYDLIATDDEVYDWTLKLADSFGRPSFKEAVIWIAKHTFKREE